MKHIKPYNESKLVTNIFNDKNREFIEECAKDCLTEYCTDYGMIYDIRYGWFTPKTHFINELLFKNKGGLGPSEEQLNKRLLKMNPKSAIDISLVNNWIGTDRKGRLEIYTDENSEDLFKSSVRNLQDQLEFELDVSEIRFPEKLLSTYYGLNITIIF